MADLTRMEELVVKRLHGKLKSKEKRELRTLAEASEENRQFIDSMSPKTIRKMRQATKGIDRDRIDRLTKLKIGHVPGVLDWLGETTKEQRFGPYSIAASVVLIAGTALWFSQRPQADKPVAGSITATLYWRHNSGNSPETTTLDSLVLGEMHERRAYPAGAVQIARIENLIFIFPWRDSATAAKDTLAYRLTDDGKQDIKVFFPDSTKSQLLPSSSLSFNIYPPGTLLTERQIACDGEALFDVNPNYEIPTVIKTLKEKITVLGTLFRVRDDKQADTGAVLCYNGKVSIKDSDKPPTILVDSQRATIQPGRAIRVSKRDFPQVKWESPALPFDFSNLDLDSAIHEIARWYGMSTVYFEKGVDRKTPGTVLTGKISRYLPLQQLLSILDRKDLHFFIYGQTIVVRGSTDRQDHDH